MRRPLLALGFATCQLPLVAAVAVGWWSPWAGVMVGGALSVLFGVIWSRRAQQPMFLFGIVAGLVFSVVGASLMLPSLRLLTGALPRYELGTAYDLGGGPPMAVEVLTIEGGAPRTDLLYIGDVYEGRSESGRFYLYSVVAPVVPAGWQRTSPVPAWAICEVSHETTGRQASVEKKCIDRFGRDPATYQREGFDADLPNAPMIEEAMARHGLSQSEDAPVFVLHSEEDAWPGIFMPLLVLVLSMGAVKGAVDRSSRDFAPRQQSGISDR